MNISIIHPFFDSIGGAEQITMILLKILHELGYKVKLYTVIPPILTPNNTQIISIKKLIKENDNLPPILNIIIRNVIPSRLKRLMQEKKITSMALDNEKIVFVMGGNMPFLKTSNAKAYVYCNSIFDSEGQYIIKQFSGPKSIYNNIIKTIIQKKYQAFLNTNAQLITNSFYTKSKIMERFGKTSVLIYPPVDLDKFKNKSETPKKDQIASIIRISPEKNPLQLIDIILKSNYPAQIGCSGKDKVSEDLYQTLLQKTRTRNITFYYNIPDIRIDNLLAHSKIYLQSSQETFGIAVIEAMASGCIPIVPNNSANIETVPFVELRFENKEEAIIKIKEAMNGKYDYLLPNLKTHLEKFSILKFKESISTLITHNKMIKQNNQIC